MEKGDVLHTSPRSFQATERECLAVLLIALKHYSIEHFRHFIEGQRFIVQTDAMSLTFLKTMSIESKSPRIARWALKLSRYDIELQYKRGSENVSADALSRSIYTLQTDLTDPYVEDLKRLVVKEPERYRDFQIVNGKLFKFVSNSSLMEDLAYRWKQVLPSAERKEVIEKIHSEAHLGFLKTLSKIRGTILLAPYG